jgi:hypothetical protein
MAQDCREWRETVWEANINNGLEEEEEEEEWIFVKWGMGVKNGALLLTLWQDNYLGYWNEIVMYDAGRFKKWTQNIYIYIYIYI